MKKINFKQPKYMLPAILYLPLIGLGWLVIDMFQTDVSSGEESDLQKTEYLNADLPEARVSDMGTKKDNMLKSFGYIKDETAVQEVGRDSVSFEDFKTKYSDEELSDIEAKMRADELARLRMEKENEAEAKRKTREELERDKRRTVRLDDSGSDDDFSGGVLSEEDRVRRSIQRRNEMFDDLEKELGKIPGISSSQLAEYRRRYGVDTDLIPADSAAAAAPVAADSVQSSAGDAPASVSGQRKKMRKSTFHSTDEAEAVSVLDSDAKDSKVVKKVKGQSTHFNTLSENEQESRMLRAMIDEEVKAVEGSRVRLKLLDDAEVAGVQLKKGSYLYATMSGFQKQRVQGTVESIMAKDELVKVTLSIYDTDGMEGLYVPESSFRETSKEVAGEALSGGNLNMMGSGGNPYSQMISQALTTAYTRTTNAVSKAIRKNKVRLKYGTQVYLINGKSEKKRK